MGTNESKETVTRGASSIVESAYDNVRYHQENLNRGSGGKTEVGWADKDAYHYYGEGGVSAAAAAVHTEKYQGLSEAQSNFVYGGVQAKGGPYGGNAGAEVGVMNVDLRASAAQFNAKALTAGADAGADLSSLVSCKVGGELKASLAEVTAKTGPFSGTLGVNANTGGSVGLGRTGLKVGGTGGYIGTDGVEFTIMGSGVKCDFNELFNYNRNRNTQTQEHRTAQQTQGNLIHSD